MLYAYFFLYISLLASAGCDDDLSIDFIDTPEQVKGSEAQ